MSATLKETDLHRSWREAREGFAAAADIIDRWVLAWEGIHTDLAATHARLVECERERDEAEHSREFNHAAAQMALDQRDALAAANNRLRAALVKCAPGGIEGEDDCRAMKRWRGWWREFACPAIAEIPATSLAEHDARVRAAERERCAKVCLAKVERPAGYRGQWEGYGRMMDDMTGPECAAGILALGEVEPMKGGG